MITEQTCDYISQCGYLNICNLQLKVCVHDPVFPITIYTGFVYLITPVILGIGMIGGLGGGILKGPVLEMMLDYDQEIATQIAYCLMFGGTFLNGIVLLFTKHPKYLEQPVVDFNLAMVFNCSISLGSNIGQILAQFLPQLVITITQEIFLLIVMPYLYQKGVNQMKIDKQEKELQDSGMNESLVSTQEKNMKENEQKLLERFKTEQKQILPPIQCLSILTFFLVTQIIMNLSTIWQDDISLPKCFQFRYLMLIILIIVNLPMTLIVFYWGRRYEALKDLVDFDLERRVFRPQIFIKVYLAGMMSGLLSGMIGIGAGLLMVPVMISMNTNPRVAAATSGFNYVWIGLTNLINLIVERSLPSSVIYLFTGLALFGGLVITKIGYYFIEKYRSAFIVIFIVLALAFLNFISGIYYVAIESKRFGFDSQLKFTFTCS